MTVETGTLQGKKVGSAVMEVRAERGYRVGDQSGNSSALLGESVVVDLSDGPVFALLRGCDGCGALQGAVTDALLSRRPGEYRHGDFIDDVGALGGSFHSARAELPGGDWPMFVHFRNIDDPRSIERVDPQAIGVERIVVVTTNDNITTGIENRFPVWFKNLASSGARLDGNRSIAVKSRPDTLAGYFSPGDFTSIYGEVDMSSGPGTDLNLGYPCDGLL